MPRHRVAMLVPVPAPYKLPIFERLAKTPDFHYRVFFFMPSLTHDRVGWSIPPNPLFEYEVLHTATMPSLALLNHKGQKLKDNSFGPRIPLDLLYRLFRWKPDVVVSLEFGFQTIFSIIYKLLTGSKLVVCSDATLLSQWWVPQWKWKVRRLMSRSIDAFCAVSNSGKQYLQKAGAKESQIFLSPLAIDNASFSNPYPPIEIQERRGHLALRKTVFLFVGRLIPYKGVTTLFDAWKTMPISFRNNASLLIIGTGSLQQKLNQRVLQEDLGDVRLLGPLPNSSLREYMWISDVLVLPSYAEVWGLVVNEALAAGLPVICSKYAGASELVADANQGRCYDPLSIKELMSCLQWAHQSHDALESIGKLSPSAVKEYTFDNAYLGIKEAIFKSLAN